MKGTKFDTAINGEVIAKSKGRKSKVKKILNKLAAQKGKKAELLMRPHGSDKFARIKVGGKMPPRMGLRRTYGLRAFTLGEGT
jgi:hypothetical protein